MKAFTPRGNTHIHPNATTPRSPFTPRQYEGKKPRMSKYMNDVSDYAYLMHLVHALSEGVEDKPRWVRVLVSGLKVAVQGQIEAHMRRNSVSRQKFVSISEDVWKDPENGMFSLIESPRPVLGYLPVGELAELDRLVMGPLRGEVEDLRRRTLSCMDVARASPQERGEIKEMFERERYFLIDVEDHMEVAARWDKEAVLKEPILMQLKAREEFIQLIYDFDTSPESPDGSNEKKKNQKTKHVTKNSKMNKNTLVLNSENEFKKWAKKTLKRLDSQALEDISYFQKCTSRDFEVDGISYKQMIKEQKFGRPNGPSDLTRLSVERIPKSQKDKYLGQSATPWSPTGACQTLYEMKIETDSLVLKGACEELIAATRGRSEFGSISLSNFMVEGGEEREGEEREEGEDDEDDLDDGHGVRW